jgi:2-hydroxy-3-oxopropionate reductase
VEREAAATAQELFNACRFRRKASDHSARVQALEKLANFEIGQQATPARS